MEYAILEENGRLSVFPSAEKTPVTPKDLNLKRKENGIAHVCVIDGRVICGNLNLAGWTRERLAAELKQRGLKLAEVFVFTVDDAGNITCVK